MSKSDMMIEVKNWMNEKKMTFSLETKRKGLKKKSICTWTNYCDIQYGSGIEMKSWIACLIDTIYDRKGRNLKRRSQELNLSFNQAK